MTWQRPAATLIATYLLCSSPALAASPTITNPLSTTAPSGLSGSTTTTATTTATTGTTTTATTTPGLPRTGDDLVAELMLGLGMLTAGRVLRRRRAA